MSPFAGEGANLAMFDGAQLGGAIAAHHGDVEAALADCEKVLCPCGEQAAAESARNLDLIFDDRASQSRLDEFAAYRDV
jgi:2-polyprenyl-6-methoxyphenol hydroxylase-like FAD-dependent oxidoreductase